MQTNTEGERFTEGAEAGLAEMPLHNDRRSSSGRTPLGSKVRLGNPS